MLIGMGPNAADTEISEDCPDTASCVRVNNLFMVRDILLRIANLSNRKNKRSNFANV